MPDPERLACAARSHVGLIVGFSADLSTTHAASTPLVLMIAGPFARTRAASAHHLSPSPSLDRHP